MNAAGVCPYSQKTKLQNQHSNAAREFTGFIDAFRKIFAKEGLKGLYRGWPPNVVLVMPEKAIKLTMNDVFRERLRSMREKKDLPFHLEVAAGGMAGFTQGQHTARLTPGREQLAWLCGCAQSMMRTSCIQ